MKKVLFISSTGGHLNELMQLKQLFNKYDYHIITEKDKSTIDLKKEYNLNEEIYHKLYENGGLVFYLKFIYPQNIY